MSRIVSSLLRWIVGRLKIIMITNWFMTFGAMALPVGFACFFVYYEIKNVHIIFYFAGWVVGIFGLLSFFIALVRSFYEDQKKRVTDKKYDDNFRSAMKTMEAIKGQLEGLRNDIKKSDKHRQDSL